MTPFQFAFCCGLLVGALASPVAIFLIGEIRYHRSRPALRRLTAEKRDDQNRRLRLVLGGAVRTPMPFRRLRTKGAE